jgi:hypothetical protein
MNTFKTLLKEIDIFGKSYNIYFDKKPLFKTVYGGIITILCLLLMVGVIFVLSEEMFQKKNPNIISRVVPSPNRVNLTFNINVGYMVEDEFANPKDSYDKYLSINPTVYNLTYVLIDNGTYIAYTSQKNLTIKACTTNDFSPSTIDFFTDNNLYEGYCVDDSTLLGGFFDDNYAYFMSIKLNKCINSTLNNFECKSSNEIDY